MSIMNLSRGEVKFLKKTVVWLLFALVLIVGLIVVYYKYFSFSSVEAKFAYEKAESNLQESEQPIYFELRCATGVPNSHQCNGKYFQKLLDLLEEKNIHPGKNGVYTKHDNVFILHYYSGPPTKCIENLCPKYEYYAQMDVQLVGDEVIPEMSIKEKYYIVHGANGKSSDKQIEQIEEIGPLEFKQTYLFLEFLNNLAQNKQKALE